MTCISVYVYLIYDVAGSHSGYVGFTSKSLKKRLGQHLGYARRGSQAHCHSAIRKLNYEVGITVLEISTSGKYREAEILWIAHFKKMGWNLWNMTDGGDGALGYKWTEAHKNASRGVRKSPQHCKNMSEGKRKRDKERPGEFAGENNPMFGERYTPEEKQEHSNIMKQYYKNKREASIKNKESKDESL